uniref:Uncharacterized protein n=1 Tax=Timema cristinae TaxID=61476 RepID=A0A7R9H2Y0_TIMCR|nr:unnamed protein product [Timema cristinae]
MGKHTSFQGKESFQRMNFLYQAEHMMVKCPDKLNLATSLGDVMVAISKKAVLRLEPSMKRTLCKGCRSLLIPGITATVRLRKKPAGCVVWSCLRCQTVKRFLTNRGHQIWAEKPEAIVQVLTCEQETTDKIKSNATTVLKTPPVTATVFETSVDPSEYTKQSNPSTNSTT